MNTFSCSDCSINCCNKFQNGFMYKASEKFPCSRLNTDRVEPHEGQGIPVILLIKQTPPEFFNSCLMVKISHV